MDLALHIGAHRTATTSLQQALTKARDVLAQGGVAFWGPKVMRSASFELFPRLHAQAAAGEVPDVKMALTEAEMAAAFALLERQKRQLLLISEENMLGTMVRNFADHALYPNARGKLSAYAALLPRQPSVIYLGVRSYADYWASAYAIMFLHGSVKVVDAARLEAATMARSWVEVVADVARSHPDARIVLWRYSADGLRDMLGAMLGPLATQVTLPRVAANASLSASGLQAYGEQQELRGTLTPKERQEVVASLRGLDGPGIRLFDAKAEAALAEKFEDDWALLASGHIAAVEIVDAATQEAPN